MVYHDLRIQYFKGIKELYMPDLRRINLLVGKNDCGKSSVLEALYLLTPNDDFAEGDHMNNMLFSWSFLKEDTYDFNFTFYNLYTSIPSVISAKENYKADNAESVCRERIMNITTHNNDSFYPEGRASLVKISFEFGTKGKYEIEIFDDHRNTVTSGGQAMVNFYRSIFYWGHHTLYLDKKKILINHALRNKRMGGITSILKSINSKILDIKFGAENKVLVDYEGVDRLMPLSYFGDGVKRSLYLLSALSYCQDGILLIDEVDTGLHHSALIPVWKALIEGAKRFNVQLFITTHSDECAEALHAVMQADYAEIMEEEYAIFCLVKEGEEHQALRLAPHNHSFFLERNWEYR